MMTGKLIVSKRCITLLCSCVTLLTASLAFGVGVRMPGGDLKMENGDLRISGTAKGIVFPDSSVQTTAAPTGLKTILNGPGDLLVAQGVDGDFFINTTSNTLFGPKTSGVWPATGVSLVGPTGATGATGPQGPAGAKGVNGKTLLSGKDDPTEKTGTDGDFYINTASNRIFGPKAAEEWPAGVSLVGPTGATGPSGANYTLPRAPVLATGQVKSYAVGDDGDWMPGASVASRFFDNGDGSVKDNLTGLIWLKNADCFGAQSWTAALTSSNTLASGSCGLTDGSTAKSC